MAFPFALIGMLASAGGSMAQGKAGQIASEYNAETLERNALFTEAERPLVVEDARNERRRLGEAYNAIIGSFRAETAAGGLDPNFGSAAYVQQDAKRAYDIDRDILARNEVMALNDKDREAYNYRRGAIITRSEGRNARTAGNVNAFTNLLQGASTISNSVPRGSNGGGAGGTSSSFNAGRAGSSG